jgi:hypothetical protein
MEILEQFAETVLGFTGFASTLAEGQLEDRLRDTRAWLSAIYQASAALDATGPGDEAATVGLSSWPGFGRFEEFWALGDPHGHEPPELCQLSEELARVTDDLAYGLSLYEAGDEQGALNYWARGFEQGYGPRILWVLPALHAAVQSFRAMPEPNSGPRTANIVMLDDTAKSKPGVMGLRLIAVEGGAEIAAVHPRGPAEGHLLPGDLVLAIDAAPVQGDSPQALGMELGGETGTTRRLTIYRSGETSEIPITLVDPEELTRAIRLRVLIPQAAERAATALRILGCSAEFFEPDELRIQPAPEVSPADVDALIDAGETNSIWVRSI